MQRLILIILVVQFLLASSVARGQPVWVSNFAADADGVVDIFDNNPVKTMIGPAVGGFLQITTDDAASGVVIDKAGRPLGTTKGGGTNFSALYKFRWSGLNQQTVDAFEAAGFLGSTGTPLPTGQTKQFCGALFRHRKAPSEVSNDYFVHMDLGFGGTGITSFGYLGGGDVNLGPNAPSNTYYLAICYTGFTHVLTLRLTDASGNRLSTLVADLDTDVAGLKVGGTPIQEINSLALTHLGWEDYSANDADRTTIWQVDSMAYYGTATGACNDLPAEPSGSCCDPATGLCSDTTYLSCQGVSCNAGVCTSGTGNFQGAGTVCASTSCPQPPIGACCNLDGSCTEGQTQLQCTNASGTWQGANSTCGQVSCPQPAPHGACCLIAAGTCTDNLTQADCEAEGTNKGVWSGANTTCAGTTCPPPATGACCQLNGTCAVTTLAACSGHWDGPGTDCTAPDACMADAPLGYLWLSTFDSNTVDQVDDVSNCHEPFGQYTNNCLVDNCANPACVSIKDMIGTAGSGRLLIDVQDNQDPTPYVPDKAGRLVGVDVSHPLRATDSFSVLYQFSWSQLYQNPRHGDPNADPGAFEFPAFFGSQWADNDPRLPTAQSRQVLGARLIHWRSTTGNYMLDLGIDCAGTGTFGVPNTAYQSQLTFSGQVTNLGPYAQGKYYQLAMGWDGNTGRFTVKLYDSRDNLLAQNSGIPATGIYVQGGVQELATLRMTHVGWVDYTSVRVGNFDTLWQLDRLALFNTSYGAFREPLSPGACCLTSGNCLENQSLAQCTTANGTWRGPGTTCAQANCPLPPCHDPFADTDGDGDVDMDDFAVFQRCYTGPAGGFDIATCHCFDRNNDNLIDNTDLSKFVLCVSRKGKPANPACDDGP